MSDIYKKYMDPSTINKIDNLSLRAKLVVEGFIIGMHKSPYHGFSVEFSEHRPYGYGDEIKYIDWNLITQITKQNQNIDFYFFGPKNSSHLSPTNRLSETIINNILNQQNVKSFGAISSDKIHGYLTQMDANIITYTADQNQKQLSNQD